MARSFLDRLIAIEKAPARPIFAGTKDDWLQAEGVLGCTLPKDYKAYIGKYGAGGWFSFFSVFSPFDSNPYVNLIDQAGYGRSGIYSHAHALRVLEAKGILGADFSVYPEERGLLCFGSTDNGGLFAWLTTSANPDTWTCAYWADRSAQWVDLGMTMTELLLKVCSGTTKILEEALGPDYWRVLPRFKAWSE